MAATARLRAQIGEFEANYSKATKHALRQNDIMKRDARDVGKNLSSGMKGAVSKLSAGIGVAGVGMAIKQSLQWADDIADLTQKLNENAETIQRVDFVAQQAASVGVEQISKAMLKLEDNLGDVANNRVTDALGRIGMSAQDLIGLPLDQKLMALSKAFQNARATGVGVADMTELVGRQAAELIPLLNLSQEALEDMFSQAPALADESIQSMAALNDQFDAMVMKGKAGVAFAVDAVSKWALLAGDIATNPFDIEGAIVRAGERDVEAEQSRITREESRKAQAEAVEASRKQVEEEKKAAEVAKEKADALKEEQQIREEMAAAEIDLLPDDQKLKAFQDQLTSLLDETVGLFTLDFDTSVEGLKELVKARESMGDRLPDSGVGSVLEALQWLQEALEKQQEIAELEKRVAKSKADRSEAEKEELEDLREEAAENTYDRLSPEEQARQLREELGQSLGIDINGMDDLERALKDAQEEVERARAAEDTEAETLALQNQIEVQERAAEFTKVAGGLAATPNGLQRQGDFQNFVDQIFGRDPQAEQLNQLREVVREGQENRRLLSVIIQKMDEPPERDRFDDFGDY